MTSVAIINPAPIASVRASATCETMSAPRMRLRSRPAVVDRVVSPRLRMARGPAWTAIGYAASPRPMTSATAREKTTVLVVTCTP